MTVTAHVARPDRPAEDGGVFDVVIIGAGISGIGAAYRLTERNPDLRYVILERREQLGGTWDLFRYPGVRSDSSIFTLCFPYEPWTRKEGVADGDKIREYLGDTARKYGIDRHIRYNSHVRAADWDSDTDTWTVTVERDGTPVSYQARFVFFGSGYYNYDEGYTPEFPGIESFRGSVIHPQHWPEDLDYTGRSVVVIGSGATAISLIPAMAEKAASVTMLQRSPTYLISASKFSAFADWLRKLLPRKFAHLIIRLRNAVFEGIIWLLARKTPALMKWILRRQAVTSLPEGYPVDVHFKPRYNPWDQRLCLIPDGDLYEAISTGRAEVVTDRIDHFDADGIVLQSGRRLDADVVVTATGLQLQALGGVTLSLDGTEIKPQDRFVYKAHMLEDVPNLFWCVGYTNASWTLRADMTARATAKLIDYMTSRGYTHAYPHLGDEPMPEKPAWDIQAGYVLRALHALPKSGTKRPWNVRQNYFADAVDYRFDTLGESMVFGRRAEPALTG
ncbi:NAD(P)/FAD-dependent oxidoreductase [Mycolicibacillus trivialis]|uniref:FAD-dependent oxidoreductase n=1 Tax=Mycolicibacillus trivialis TaxID=1798 RepID=A0A1X2EN27_9MYCO|nr:NAD(P)/FAD-dependent oxidoreductase [Mycolicibacillus trivialis]ORX06139.1 FAD-dependent oxidoreductase [Mycolicibacillus trivialis]